MTTQTLSRSLRSPAASTVLAIVLGFSGLAYAGSRAGYDVPPLPSSSKADDHQGAGAAVEHEAGEHGAEVSAFARETELVGWRKGAAVSALASDGKSQAGEHGPHAGEEPGASAPREPGTAPNAHAEAGRAHAEEHPGQAPDHAVGKPA
jgi:hypothetical protein